MEFNQENRSFCTPSAVLDTVAEQLADVDLTLPDYCPDIEKILKCTLTPKIQSRTLSGGQLQIDGFCTVNVMYVESIKEKRALLRTKREFFTELFGKRRSRQSGYHHKNKAGIHKLQGIKSPQTCYARSVFVVCKGIFKNSDEHFHAFR